MVEGEADEAVTYVNSNAGFGSLRIVKGVDRLIYSHRYRHGGRTSMTISTPKISLRIPIDLLNMEVEPELHSCVLSISSASKSTRILPP